jgi:peroxiredoxin
MTEILNESTPKEQVKAGLAIASLVLGIISILSSLVVVGGLLSIVGLTLGFLHLKKHAASRTMAKWGMVLSVVALLASIGFGYMYYRAYKYYVASGTGNNEELEEWEGVLAPDFTVATLDGKQIHLSDLHGKRVIIDVWATWCPPCQQEIPHFIRLVKESNANDLVVVGVSAEEKDVLSKFIKEKGINYSVASSSELPSPYKDVESIPATFFVDRNGVIQTVFQGYHDYEALRMAALSDDFKGTVKRE